MSNNGEQPEQKRKRTAWKRQDKQLFSVKCDDCKTTFPSYAKTKQKALILHKRCNPLCHGGHEQQESGYEQQDFSFEEICYPVNQIEPPRGALFIREQVSRLSNNRESELSHQILLPAARNVLLRDSQNSRNTRSQISILLPLDNEENRGDDNYLADECDNENDSQGEEEERRGMIAGESNDESNAPIAPEVLRAEDPPLCDFLSIVRKENVNYCRLSEHDRRTEWTSKFVTYKPQIHPNDPLIEREGIPYSPSFAGLEFQRFLLEYYPNARDYLKHNKKMGVEVDMDLIFQIHQFLTEEHVSSKGGEKLFNIIYNVVGTKFTGKGIPVPQYRSVKAKINRNLETLFPLRVEKIHLPKDFFPEQYKGKPLLPSIGVFYDFLPRLFQFLLNMDPDDFMESPSLSYQDVLQGKDVLYTNFMSGELACDYDREVKAKYGGHATALMFAIYFDDTTMNKTMSRTECPLYCLVLNAIGKGFQVIFLGLVPNKFAYDRETMEDIIQSQGCAITGDNITLARMYAKREKLRDFIYRALKCILTYEEHGIYALVGRGPKQKKLLLFIFLASILADTIGRDDIAGTSFQKLTCKCCSCEKADCLSCIHTPRWQRCWDLPQETYDNNRNRNDIQTDNYGLKLHAALAEEFEERSLIKRKTQRWRRPGSTKEKAERADVLDCANYANMSIGANYIHLLFAQARRWGINSFYRSLRFDYLHIWLKGWEENCVCDVVAVVGMCNKQKFASLDRILGHFNFSQTLHLSRHIRWFRGISAYQASLGTTKLGGGKKKGGQSTMTGGIEAWKFPSLLSQLCFGIGSDTTILPCGQVGKNWYQDNVMVTNPMINIEDKGKMLDVVTGRLKTDQRGPWSEKTIDIHAWVMRAMTSILEVQFVIRSTQIHHSYLEDYSLLIANARIHSEMLRNLRRRCEGRHWKRSWKIKPHSGTKFPKQSRICGHMRNATDTSMPEAYHPKVKSAFEGTAKRTWGSPIGICVQLLRQERADNLFDEMNEYKASAVEHEEGLRVAPNMADEYHFNIFQPPTILEYVNDESKFVSEECSYICKGNQCSNPENHKLNCWHPFLSAKSVYELLESYAKIMSDTHDGRTSRQLIWNALDPEAATVAIEIWSAVKMRGNHSMNVPDFQIHATNNYNFNHNELKSRELDNRKISNFSFVMINFGAKDSSNNEVHQLCQVLSIIGMNGHARGREHQIQALIVVTLSPSKTTAKTSRLPYKTYKYTRDEKDKSALSVHTVSLDAVGGPAFVMNVNNTSAFAKPKFDDEFYMIPVSRVNAMEPIPYKDLTRMYPETFWSIQKIDEQADLLDRYFP